MYSLQVQSFALGDHRSIIISWILYYPISHIFSFVSPLQLQPNYKGVFTIKLTQTTEGVLLLVPNTCAVFIKEFNHFWPWHGRFLKQISNLLNDQY